MTHTRANEDKAADEIEMNAAAVVAALRRLDSMIEERDAEIERLQSVIESLNDEIAKQ